MPQPNPQRELSTLIGAGTPPVLVQPTQPFRNTPEWRRKVVPWKRVEFSNGARSDGLKLKHWVRGTVDEDEPYRFARFNIKVQVPEWTDKDYELFKAEGWTLEETRYLFNLCAEYDLKWFIVHDRYKHNRTVEEIKERYYDVCRALLKRNPSPADLEEIQKMVYSKEKEIQRKTHLEHLMARTSAEVAEEEALVLESRRLEALGERFLREREEIIGFLDTPTSTANTQQYNSSQGLAQLHQQLLSEKSRKPKEARVARSAMATSVLQKRLSAKEEASYGITYSDKLTPGVQFRSARLPALRPAIAQKARAVLAELGIPQRPVMATAKVCDKFDALQQAVQLLLDTKMIQDRLELAQQVKQQGES